MSPLMRPWILLLPILLPACAASQSTGPRAGQLVTAIAEIRAESVVPALGAAVSSPDCVLAAAVDGVRKIGTENPVRISDAFHIGSVAKTMTATLAAQLVESGALAWNTRVAEMLPEEMARARSEYRELTLAQLLSHEAGIQPLTDDVEIAAVPELHGDIVEQRRQLTGWLLQQPPIAPVGTAYAYSNAGFVIVAAMMEALTGESWETLMRERIFRPLGMSTAGFGWPGENAPDKNFLWGHQADGERVLPVDPDGEYQLPQVLAPAGDVHASLADMARYAAAYLRAWCGDMSILEGDTVRAMYRQRIKSGIGWGVQAAFGFDSVAVYSGSADTFFFLIAVIPEAGRAFVAGSNAADPQAQKATVALLKRIVAEHSGDSD